MGRRRGRFTPSQRASWAKAAQHRFARLVESAFARWFAGDDEQCDSFVAELERRVTTANERGHRFFIACTRGAAHDVPYGYEKAKARAQGLLIASARADTPDGARRFASDAVVVTDQSERRYLRIVTRCALAVLDDARREKLLDAALLLGAGVDSEPMRSPVTALVEGRSDAGMLAPFLAQYERFRRNEASIEVNALCGNVLAEGKSVPLSRSELAVLIALGREPRSYSVVNSVIFYIPTSTPITPATGSTFTSTASGDDSDATPYSPMKWAIGSGLRSKSICAE